MPLLPVNVMGQKRKRYDGFTLIEILVVIGIISVIAAILLPVLASARDRARATACAGNMRQIGLAMSMYIKDYNNTYPPYGDLTNHCTWVDSVISYAKSPAIFECSVAKYGKYVPGCVEPNHGNGYIEYFNGSYVLNDFINLGGPIRESRVRYPSEAVLVAEGESGHGKFYIPAEYSLDIETIENTALKIRHHQGSNNLFVDGHVKWLSTNAMTNNDLWTLK